MNINTEEYRRKLTTPEQIAAQIKPGWDCCSDIALAIPYAISNAIGDRVRKHNLSGVTMHTILDIFPMDCYNKELNGKLRGVSWFSGTSARTAIDSGYGDIMPCYYRDMPNLFSDYVNIDAYCAVVSPMDRYGYFSTGGTGSNSLAMIQKAKNIFLEVNENMPRALSAPVIHISQVTALCENNVELQT